MTLACRLLLLAALVCVSSLIWFEARWLLAWGYSSEVRVSDRRSTAATSLLAAGRIATRLAPWDSSSHLELARLLYASESAPAEIEIEYRAAIEQAPADAYAWMDRAQMLAAQRRFGAELEVAMARTRELAPSAQPIQLASAQLGLKYWFRGSPQLQKLWIASMAYELRNEPRRFLQSAIASHNRYWLCASAALELPLDVWCSGVWQPDEPKAPASPAPWARSQGQ